MNDELFGDFPIDSEFDLFVDAWVAYYKAADLVDGYIDDSREAVEAGRNAQRKVLQDSLYSRDVILNEYRVYAKWNQAKLEALRRLGK